METRELPIYTLVVARSDGTFGPRMSVSKNDCARREGRPLAPPPGPPVCNWFGRPGSMIAGGIRIETLVEMLSRNVERPVIDRTGLTGFYDFELTFNPGTPLPPPPAGAPPLAPTDPDAPSLFTALQGQLGLKLDATRGPVEVLVIDRIERPTTD
jgi:bla regulator protein blaR1